MVAEGNQTITNIESKHYMAFIVAHAHMKCSFSVLYVLGQCLYPKDVCLHPQCMFVFCLFVLFSYILSLHFAVHFASQFLKQQQQTLI